MLPVCWAASTQVDSSIYAYWLMTSRDSVPKVVSYLNAVGQSVDISSGGAISSGHCCCSGTGGGSTVSIIDNTDGTYTAIVDGDSTIINTNAVTSYVSIPISVGDTVFLSGSNVQEILNAFSTEVRQIRSRTGCDLLVVQVDNPFQEGDLLAQDSTTGVFYLSSSDSTKHWPVGYVCEKIGPDSFYVDTEGWLVGAHSFTPYRDYFNQDTSGVATVPGSIQQFAFRTFSDSLRYFDIPEYAVDGSVGGGSGDDWGTQVIISDGTLSGDGTSGDPLSVVGGGLVTASNGLNDQDGGADVDVELGGTIDKATTVSVTTGAFPLTFGGNNNLIRFQSDRIRVVPNTATELSRPIGAVLRKNTATGSNAEISYTEYGLPYFAPLTFSSNYHIYYESDKTMKWVYQPVEGNGMFINSALNPAGGAIERTMDYGLGGPIDRNTAIRFDSTFYFTFEKSPTVTDTSYQFNLSIFPTDTSPTIWYHSRVYDVAESRWNNGYYQFNQDSLSFTLGNSVGDSASNVTKLILSRGTGLQVSFQNNLTQYIHLNANGIDLEFGGSSIQIDPNGNIVYTGVPNYASDAAADADGTLPSGAIYTVTAENRYHRIKP